jgi:hypothetical protein
MPNKLTVSLLVAGAAVAAGMWGQDKPSPFGQNPVAAADVAPVPPADNSADVPAPASAPRSAPSVMNAPEPRPAAPASNVPAANTRSASRDPFPEDVALINQNDLVWRAAQNRLEELGSGCITEGNLIIDQARDAKLKSVAAYAKYYQDTIGYWTKSRDSAGEAELSSRTDSAELQAHVNQLELELQSVNRRKADLDRTFGENHVDSNEERAALADLTRIQANKKEQVEKGRAALDQNKSGHDWVMKRKEYARVRLAETNDLLQSTRTELYLYQQLYNAILYRHSLSCDREVGRPIETLSDWRQDLKRLSPGSDPQK